ncbi:transposase [Clostridium sp. 'deep sea']|uniref:transposase n=1 Tax=Clostridium sp. 'deep sea' TaxID=2779445 RepID=UPI0018969478|nr:transposase [Clostridium sp. 'deep sea']QOR35307.1 transposase [Clostridium sp. 'deep sea']
MVKPKRKQTRLKNYDYSRAGCYFVTMCTQNMRMLLGDIVNGKMILSYAGLMAERILNQTPNKFNNIELNKYIIMPNHVHTILKIKSQSDLVGANLVFACSNASNKPKKAMTSFASTMGNFVKSFKSKTTVEYIKAVKKGTLQPFEKRIWQRNYHDHIIRNQKDYQRIWQYIDTNVQKWELDRYYSE